MSNQTFSAALKVYRPVNILMDEVKKRDYIFRNVKKDERWKGGTYKIPLNTNRASSIKFGALTATASIHEAGVTMGQETSYIEIYHSLKFNHLDMDLGDNYEGSYIKVIKDTVEPAAVMYKEAIARSILSGGLIDSATANGDSNGLITVSSPERFELGQYLVVRVSTGPAAVAGYITAIDMNTGVLTIKDARSGGSAVDLTGYTVAYGAALYMDGTVNTGTGALQNNFNDLRSVILSSANGGGSAIHGLTKASYVQLQAHNKDLSGATSESLLENLFDLYVETSKKGRGNPSEIFISYKNYAHCVKSLENNRLFSVSDVKSGFGFKSLKVGGPDGDLRITALREMDEDIVFVIDWNAFKLAGYKWFENETMSKIGQPYFVERERSSGSGYEYIQDIKFYGNVVFYFLSYLGAGHSISIS